MMKTFARPRLLVLAQYIASAALVTVQQAILRHSNNVSIFRSASFNLFAGRDLYAAHPEQHFDFYKYSPTFAVLFAPVAYLPFALTFLCWTLLNGLLLWYALDRLLPEREATVALALLYLEVLLALQYGQSNALVAALMVLAFVAFEARRPVGAAASITLGAAVKLFPLAALPVAVFHPRRLRFAAIFIAVLAAAIALPLVAIPPGDLLAQYRSWHAMEAKDALRRGYSLMHYVHAWFGVDWPNWPLQAAGTALLLLPVALRPDRWASLEFRRLFLCSLLVYSVLFNHASESPSFVVAYAGIVIWYASSPPSRVRTVVMALTLLVMIVHDVDVVPRWVKYDILVPYRIKGIPCLVAWFVMQWELLVTARSTARIDTGTFPRQRQRREPERHIRPDSARLRHRPMGGAVPRDGIRAAGRAVPRSLRPEARGRAGGADRRVDAAGPGVGLADDRAHGRVGRADSARHRAGRRRHRAQPRCGARHAAVPAAAAARAPLDRSGLPRRDRVQAGAAQPGAPCVRARARRDRPHRCRATACPVRPDRHRGTPGARGE